MGALEPGHLVLILIIVLVVFGPGKLPELGKALGEGLRELKRATDGGAPSSTVPPRVAAPYPGDSLASTGVGPALGSSPQVPQPGAPGRPCPACHAAVPLAARFCGACGAPVDPAAAGASAASHP